MTNYDLCNAWTTQIMPILARIWHRDSKTANQTCSPAYCSNAAVEHVPQGLHKAINHHCGAKVDQEMTTSARCLSNAHRGDW